MKKGKLGILSHAHADIYCDAVRPFDFDAALVRGRDISWISKQLQTQPTRSLFPLGAFH